MRSMPESPFAWEKKMKLSLVTSTTKSTPAARRASMRHECGRCQFILQSTSIGLASSISGWVHQGAQRRRNWPYGMELLQTVSNPLPIQVADPPRGYNGRFQPLPLVICCRKPPHQLDREIVCRQHDGQGLFPAEQVG